MTILIQTQILQFQILIIKKLIRISLNITISNIIFVFDTLDRFGFIILLFHMFLNFNQMYLLICFK
jgi:hypothetical protein